MEVAENMQQIYILAAEYQISFYHMIFSLIFILIVFLLRKYRKFMKLYAEFPTYPLILHLAYARILGKVPKHLSFNAYLLQKLVLLTRRFQKEGFFLIWAPKPVLFIYSQEAIQIFSNEPAALNKSDKYEILKDAFGLNLATRNGDSWKKHRRMLNPVFNMGILKNKMYIFDKRAQEFVKNLEAVASETAIDVLPYICLCVVRLFCESIIGLDLDTVENQDASKEMLHVVEGICKLTMYRICNPWLHSKFMLRFTPTGRKYLKMYDKAHFFIRKVLLMMKQSVMSSKNIKGEEKSSDSEVDLHKYSFAHILFQHLHEDSTFTMEELQSEVTTFISGGYDTISHSLLWSIFLLGNHPDVQEKAYNEVESVWKGKVQYEDLYNLKFLECVIKESLRLYPVVPIYARNINKDIQCGNYMVPKGTDIVFCPFMLHRNPEIYSDPDKFDPDRFSYSEGTRPIQSSIFIPFSEGIRDCIGKKFAMIVMKVILSHILHKFRITSLDKEEDVSICWEVVLCPQNPLKMQLSLRK